MHKSEVVNTVTLAVAHSSQVRAGCFIWTAYKALNFSICGTQHPMHLAVELPWTPLSAGGKREGVQDDSLVRRLRDLTA